ncbi:MAG: class I SAM-dependent methyltransferase [Candidatus Berkiella sp.]
MSDDSYIEKNVPLFEAIYGKGLISLGGYQAIDNMFQNIDIKDKTILDIGSGIGGMAYHLAGQYHCHVIGLEIHQWMADYAMNNVPPLLKGALKFISYAPDGPLPVSDHSIDICCSKGVLTNVEKKLELFKELHRILKSNGQVVFIDWLVPEAAGSKYERLRLGDMSFKETPSRYSQILEKAGFNHTQFIDKSQEYLEYVNQLDVMYHSIEHKKSYANIISDTLRHELIQANNDLKQSIESGQQLSMLILAIKQP